ncbi:PQQ-binding-like beta-propeller repeat protein [Verrucomicrobiota bacterium]
MGEREDAMMRVVQGSRARTGVALCLWLTVSAAGASSPLVGSVRDLESKGAALEALWRSELVRAHGGRPVPLVRLDLGKAVANRDLVLVFLPTARGGRHAWAWSEGINRQIHRVPDLDLPLTTDADQRDVSGTAEIVFRVGPGLDTLERDLYFAHANQHTVKVRLTLRVQNGSISGRYELIPEPRVEKDPRGVTTATIANPFTPTAGNVTGRIVMAAPVPALFESAPVRVRDGDDETVLCGTAERLEQRAEEFYQELRVLDIVRRYTLDYSTAQSQVVVPRFARPELDLRTGDAAPRKTKPDAAPSLDDLDLGDSGEALESPSKAAASPPSKAPSKEGLQRVAVIAARLDRMVRLAKQACQADAADPGVPAGSVAVGDPDFGPWYGESVVEIREDGVNVLPANIGSEGPQDWMSVRSWRAFNPLPVTRNALVTPRLPDIVFEGSEECVADREHLDGGVRCGATIEWKPIQDMKLFGYLGPKQSTRFNPYSRGLPPPLGYREYFKQQKFTGGPFSTAYMRCVVESPGDKEVWAGLGVNQEGRLWVNDRLVWCGPDEVDPIRHETYGLIRIPFVKGRNELVVRIDSDFSSPYMWLRLCRSGAPRDAATASASVRAREAKRGTLPPVKTVGWRGDGTGLYPECDPPVAWDRKTRDNVLWYTPLPFWGNATAVPVPDSNRLFVTMDPHWLMCLNKDTGEILWKKAVTLMDLLPEEDRKAAWTLCNEWWKTRQDLDSTSPAGPGLQVLKWMQYEWYWAEEQGKWAKPEKAVDEREGATPELLALLDRRDELTASSDPNAVRAELESVLKKIKQLQLEEVKSDPTSQNWKFDAEGKALHAWVKLLRKHSRIGFPAGYWFDYTGYTFATPITDGKHVWVKNGMDVAACFDLDGNEIWKVQVHSGGSTDGTTASPLLIDGKFITHVNPSPQAPGTRMVAFDAETGKIVWDVQGLPPVAWAAASLARMTLTDGTDIMDVVVTPAGAVVRVEDGKILVHDSGAVCMFDSPVVDGDKVIFSHGAMVCVQYIMKSRDAVGFKHLWTVRGGTHGMTDCNSVIIVDNRVYTPANISLHGNRTGQGHATTGLRASVGPGERWKSLEAYDMVTGRYAVKLHSLRKGGNHYSLASASKRHIYQIDGDHLYQQIHPKHPMDMVVVERGPEPLRLANNAIGRLYGAGALDGDRIYIRSYGGVACIGYTGEAGRRYEARTVARNVMDDIYADRPVPAAEKTIPVTEEPVVNTRYPYQHERALFHKGPKSSLVRSGEAPSLWWMLGPLPAGQGDAAPAAMGGPNRALTGDGTNTINGVSYVWGPLTRAYLKTPGFKEWELDPWNYTDIHRLRRVVQLEVAIERKAPSVVYLMSSLRSEAPRRFRFEQRLPGVRAWLGGVPVEHGDRLRIDEGFCQLLMEIRVDAIPEQGIQVSPRFWASEDVTQETTEWTAAVTKREPYLRRVIELAPKSVEAVEAQRLLGCLK